jgi:UDP-N-acetylmuramyl pentapeptide phosphotransferase/UDP-N-acetylglucosamine-1-phosphate transferase
VTAADGAGRLLLVAAVPLAALLAGVLITLLMPHLRRHALASPNARSSHRVPTPQGGGIAVVAAMLGVAWMTLPATGAAGAAGLALVTLATAILAVLGGVDDVRPLPAAVRLVVQAGAVALVIFLASPGRLMPDWFPEAAERLLLVVGGVWFVNLVNFMDGLDWMSVAETVPVGATIVICAAVGIVPLHVGLLGAGLLGAMLAFAPFNRPVARLFLGDVGSLPIGLVMGWMLLQLAASAGLAAALLPPLYYLADTGVTLGRRLARGERVWEAHRGHFYQRATVNGHPVVEIAVVIFTLNLALSALALGCAVFSNRALHVLALALGCSLVAVVLRRFSHPASHP